MPWRFTTPSSSPGRWRRSSSPRRSVFTELHRWDPRGPIRETWRSYAAPVRPASTPAAVTVIAIAGRQRPPGRRGGPPMCDEPRCGCKRDAWALLALFVLPAALVAVLAVLAWVAG